MASKIQGYGWEYEQHCTLIRGRALRGPMMHVTAFGFFLQRSREGERDLSKLGIEAKEGGFRLTMAYHWIATECDRILVQGDFVYLCNEQAKADLGDSKERLTQFLSMDKPESELSICDLYSSRGDHVARMEFSGYTNPYVKIHIFDPAYRADEAMELSPGPDGTLIRKGYNFFGSWLGFPQSVYREDAR